ncbi:helix-turn-helix domain-containing protein [Ruminococcus sp.]|uniref:helix-turn-helix domain-containing protein n=1 Tax=Ruminococcus sp. TaxID=41978 RepID=UPI00344EAED3
MHLTTKQKNELISAVTALLEKMIPLKQEPITPTPLAGEPLEMLTIKECAALVSGLTEHTVRMLVKQGKVKSIRCGEGSRGKILVSKDSLLKYLGAVCA